MGSRQNTHGKTIHLRITPARRAERACTSGYRGEWEPAVIKGNLIEAGWGASMGYPGLVIDESGNDVHGHVFASSNLSPKWAYLDELEGEEYERIVASVTLLSGEQVQAHVYVLRV